MIIYENIVKAKGSLVGEFGDGMFILFGDNAPDMLSLIHIFHVCELGIEC